MKSLLIYTAIAFSTLGTQTFASGNNELIEKIESITLESESVDSYNENIDFVKVSFVVNQLGRIEILETNYSNEKLMEFIAKKLESIEIDGKHDAEQVHSYKFSFESIV